MKSVSKNGRRMIAVAFVAGVAGLGIGAALASQPQMEAALGALHSAQSNLSKITMDKGGHAAAARRMVDGAIGQVEAGIAYGKEHGL